MKSDAVFLRHMVDAIDEIQRILQGLAYIDLVNDSIRIHASIRLFEILGEAAGNLSDEFRTAHPAIPFADIIGMRNKLIHHYFEVDLEILWKTYEDDLADLKEALQNSLQEE